MINIVRWDPTSNSVSYLFAKKNDTYRGGSKKPTRKNWTTRFWLAEKFHDQIQILCITVDVFNNSLQISKDVGFQFGVLPSKLLKMLCKERVTI